MRVAGLYEGGPLRAIHDFLARTGGRYEGDRGLCDYFGRNVTWNVDGYLRRVGWAACDEPPLRPGARVSGALRTLRRADDDVDRADVRALQSDALSDRRARARRSRGMRRLARRLGDAEIGRAHV